MLFGYPIAATQNNWLHDCLCEAVRTIHASVDAKKRYPGWPSVLPKVYRETLKSRTGLRDRLKSYHSAVRRLTKAERDVVLDALESENRIGDLLSGACECARNDGLPQDIQEPVAELFEFAFGLLTDLAVRDQQYAAIYAASSDHVCPFCGTEYFDAPGAVREGLDHYLARSRYPFAAANLRNLVPMGYKCNSNYKLASDLLRRGDGSRRVAFDPYNHTRISVSLDDSEPFDGTTEHTPNWMIRFDPETPAAHTWDEVFSVRERYRRDHLDPSFRSWLDQFAKIARRTGVRGDSDAELIAVLKWLEDLYGDSGLQDRAFLKAAAFRMLRRHCEAGHQRLLKHLRNLVAQPTPLPVADPTGSSMSKDAA
ncbi:hypothetical protein JY651_22980 [Pyxidicoccus parkwayensis]|uniref:Uncharacterized protein n=1 Tax=Pyxidicoccus parkwayensis TaxID=2813578 RepID=A0ABX7PAV7_9BACT|nr:hypothetical protein [Pyxidicoccus parkwaysis]QSQ27601.1 hypothetical protein JY651_22980 [Pyxidicoccus parkwaysis]